MSCLACALRLLATRRASLSFWETTFRAELGPLFTATPGERTRAELVYARRLHGMAEIRVAELRAADSRR